MATVNPERFDLSATSIATFKACPQKFRLAYREGLRLDEDTDAQRMGTNWHALHEVYHNAYTQQQDHDAAFAAAVDHLNEQYATVPDTKTPEEWETERQVLLVSFMVYQWYWADDPYEVLASEVAFDLPLHHPKVGLPLLTSEVVRRGKIDHVVRWHGMVGNLERKSTSKAIDASSDFWDRSQKDTQVSMYALAFRDMQEHGLEHYGIHGVEPHERVGNTLYDVWRKPTIKPAKLTQKDTTTLIETGSYCDVEFAVVVEAEDQITVDGEPAEVEVGKSGKPAIRETSAMFAARLTADMQERPEHYFARKEIPRTDQNIRKFRTELFNIYQAQKLYANTGCWFENESQCRATFKCAYIPICYGPGADAVCDGETTPEGFKRIYTDITIGDSDE